MKEVNGALDAKGMKVALVVSRFNSFLTEQLVKGALDAFVRLGGSEKDAFRSSILEKAQWSRTVPPDLFRITHCK